MRTALFLAATLATLAPTTAHAADSEVHGAFGVIPVLAGDNLFVIVECDAEAIPGESMDVPVATSVWCTVDGVEQSAVAPGPAAATAFLTISRRTFQICVRAEATFHNLTTHAIYRVQDTGRCETVEF